MSTYGETARSQLEQQIMPFWLTRGVDERNGGFYTCFDNSGAQRLSTLKYVWSQGRFVWTLAKAAGLARAGLLSLDPEHLLKTADAGARFLDRYAVLPDGTCRFLIAEDGRDLASSQPDTPSHSVSADCFVALGFLELARQTGDAEWLDRARPIVQAATRATRSGRFPNAPYDLPPGFEALGPKMLLLNLATEYATATAHIQGRHDSAFDSAINSVREARQALLSHRRPDGHFMELCRGSGSSADTVLEQHCTPGHVLEALWMLVAAEQVLGLDVDYSEHARSAALTCRSGWDTTYGGLLRYTNRHQPLAPSGVRSGLGYESLIEQTWSTKLWWVHSEAAFTTALLGRRFPSSELAQWFERIWAYTLDTFPADEPGNEWVQIRDRRGVPLSEVVALPVKDPYHIARNLMQMIELAAEG